MTTGGTAGEITVHESLITGPVIRDLRSVISSRHCRQDGHLITILHCRVQAVQEPDVLALHVHVHEAAQVAVLGDPLAQPLEALVEAVEHLADRGDVLDARLGLAARDAAELRWDLDRDRHWGAHLSQRKRG